MIKKLAMRSHGATASKGYRFYGEGGAAELLGINPTTLASRLRAFKITPARPRGSRSDRVKAKDIAEGY